MIKDRRGACGQFHALHGLVKLLPETLAQAILLRQGDVLKILWEAFAARFEHRHRLSAQVDDAAKAFALAHRPSHGHARHAQFPLDFIQDVQGVTHFAVHLVDEGEDGGVALSADFNQATGLRFDAVGGIDDHQRRVHRGEHTVGVFRKVFVARGVQQVDHMIAVLHLHDRGGHRNAALLFDFHPVAGGVSRGLARFD